MHRFFPLILAFLFITGCGADVVTSTAIVGVAKKQEAKNREAMEAQDRVVQQLEDANKTAQQRMEEAERQANQ